jgi:hypothetical protein
MSSASPTSELVHAVALSAASTVDGCAGGRELVNDWRRQVPGVVLEVRPRDGREKLIAQPVQLSKSVFHDRTPI